MSITVTETVDRIPILGGGEIEIKPFMRGQKFTKNGYRRDEVVSALQKAIRRGLGYESMFWFKQLYDMGGPHRTNAINRLKIMLSEDISIANGSLVNYAYRWFNNEGHKRPFKELCTLVWVMAKSKKCRIVDNLICYIMNPKVKNVPKGGIEIDFNGDGKLIDDYRSPRDDDYQKSGDQEDLDEYMSYFIKALELKNVERACYWVQQIYDIPEDNEQIRDTFCCGESKDPIYTVWEMLYKFYKRSKTMRMKSKNPLKGRRKYKNWSIRFEDDRDESIFQQLASLFGDLKKGRSGADRLPLVHAIVHYCCHEHVDWIEMNTLMNNDDYKIPLEVWRKLQKLKKIGPQECLIGMPDYALDKHTVRGKKLGKGFDDFFTNGAVLNNVPNQLLQYDVLGEQAKLFMIQRSKEGLRYKRPKYKPKSKKLKKNSKKRNSKKRKRQTTLDVVGEPKRKRRKKN